MVKEAEGRGHALRLAALALCTGLEQAKPGTDTQAPRPRHSGGSSPPPTPSSAVEFPLLYWQLLWLQVSGGS